MRLVKGALFGILVVSLVAMWNGRGRVTDAYRDRPETEAVRLSGVDLAYRASEIEPSPYLLPAAPDTHQSPPASVVVTAPAASRPRVSLRGGKALLEGSVVGPDGPVAGAIVHLERHTSEGVGYLDTTTDADGTWTLQRMAGGRYRIRAWLPERLTMGRSEVRYIADDEVASFEFSLWGVDPTPRLEFVDGGPMYEGVPATVAVFLGSRSIDAEGVAVTSPIPGTRIDVRTTAQVQVLGQPFGLTDAQGAARFLLRCVPGSTVPPGAEPAQPPAPATGPGSGPTTTTLAADTAADTAADLVGAGDSPGPAGSLTATSGGRSATFDLPGCLPVPAPEPAPDEPPVPGDPDGGTGDG